MLGAVLGLLLVPAALLRQTPYRLQAPTDHGVQVSRCHFRHASLLQQQCLWGPLLLSECCYCSWPVFCQNSCTSNTTTKSVLGLSNCSWAQQVRKRAAAVARGYQSNNRLLPCTQSYVCPGEGVAASDACNRSLYSTISRHSAIQSSDCRCADALQGNDYKLCCSDLPLLAQYFWGVQGSYTDTYRNTGTPTLPKASVLVYSIA